MYHIIMGKRIGTEIGSILVFGLAVFTLLALVTYDPKDPSLFSNHVGAAANACGWIGAILASLILECFGIAGFLFPAVLFFVASVIIKREGSARLVGTLSGMACAVMSLTVFLSLQWKYWPYSGRLLPTGGALGAWLSLQLSRHLNVLGGSIVSLLIFALAVGLSTPLSVAKAGSIVLGKTYRYTIAITRLLGTYLAYLAGLLIMRVAHVSGDLLQKAIEKGIEKRRERLANRAREQLEELRRKALVGEPVEEVEVVESEPSAISEAQVVTPPVQLPLEAEAQPSSESQSEEGDAIEVSKLLPKTTSTKNPEIVPFKRSEEATEAAQKIAAKLAKYARSKRGQWKLPVLEFLRKPIKVDSAIDKERLYQNARLLEQKLKDFEIDGEVTAVRPGPVITLYEFKPGPGIKVSKIASLTDDLSMALSAKSVRILAPLPGKSVVGIEIPSENRESVFMREFLQQEEYLSSKYTIPVVMGKDIAGEKYFADLARMPHLLCAGQTGSGKSVFMNGLICSLLYRFTPDEMRMILVDPKFVEFRSYQDIPHLLLPVVDDPKQASTALKWAVREMERRYRILYLMREKNLAGFNQKVDEMGADVVRDLLLSEENQNESQAHLSGADWIEAFEPDENGAPKIGKLPYIVVIIDELADLMMIARKEVEMSIARIAQKARASGIHLVIATQRPSTDVVTGLIKANLTSRVSFQLQSYVDSKTILDRGGAERLLGQGDMLFIPPGTSQLLRLHGAYLEDHEIDKVTDFLRSQGKPIYRDEILVDEEDEDSDDSGGESSDDELFGEALELVKRSGTASASYLQRHLKVGYNRAARMIETMEERGIVGPQDGSRPREVLIR